VETPNSSSFRGSVVETRNRFVTACLVAFYLFISPLVLFHPRCVPFVRR
jgi:hypothetical protein